MSERQIAVTSGISLRTVGEYLRRASVSGITWPLPEGLRTMPSWNDGRYVAGRFDDKASMQGDANSICSLTDKEMSLFLISCFAAEP